MQNWNTFQIVALKCIEIQWLNPLCFVLQLSIAPTDLRLNDDYTKHYNQNLRMIFTGVIPIAALVYFNYKIYTAFKQRLRNMRGKQSTF